MSQGSELGRDVVALLSSTHSSWSTKLNIENYPELAALSRAVRRANFADVGCHVEPDQCGFPSVERIMAQKRKAAGSLHPVEQFQRHDIYSNNARLVDTMRSEGILWQFLRIHMGGIIYCSDSCATQEYVERGVSNEEFNEIFTTRWGAEMLRKPCKGDYLFNAGSDAVVCDVWPYLLGLEKHPDACFEPVKIIFAQTLSGLEVEGIITKASESDCEVRYHFRNSSAAEWLWAKRMAISTCFTSHQLQYHLAFGHFVMEAFVALAYKHLSQEHFVFRFLEPICGDVGFINRSWGIEVICDLPTPEGTKHPRVVPAVSALTGPGCLEAVLRAQRLMRVEDLLWFDNQGYMQGGSGVFASTPMPYRDTATKLFAILLRFAEQVVVHHWKHNDESLAAWWEAVWSWEKMAPRRCTLTQSNLSHLLATLCFSATYRHDHSHDEWCWQNHSIVVPTLRHGDKLDPRTYLPTYKTHLLSRAFMIGLNGGNIESPLQGYAEAFPDLADAVQEYIRHVDKIIYQCGHRSEIGTMTH